MLRVERKERVWRNPYVWEKPNKGEWLIQRGFLFWQSRMNLCFGNNWEIALFGKLIVLALKEPLSKRCQKDLWAPARPCRYWVSTVNRCSSLCSAGLWFVPAPACNWSQKGQFNAGSVYFRRVQQTFKRLISEAGGIFNICVVEERALAHQCSPSTEECKYQASIPQYLASRSF